MMTYGDYDNLGFDVKLHIRSCLVKLMDVGLGTNLALDCIQRIVLNLQISCKMILVSKVSMK